MNPALCKELEVHKGRPVLTLIVLILEVLPDINIPEDWTYLGISEGENEYT